MRYLSTKGIIIKKQNRAENDNFITIFSPDLGKFNAISKSSRKITSSLMGHLEMLNICNFQIYKTTNNFTITQCQLYKSYLEIRNNLDKSLFAFIITEIIQKSTAGEEQSSSEIFELLTRTLTEIEQAKNYEFIVEKFKIELLQLLGSLPEIAHCFFCRKKWEIQEKIWIDQQGHLACEQCLKTQTINEIITESMISAHTFEHIPFPLVKLIHYLSKNHHQKIEKIILSIEEQFQMKKVMNIFLNNYLYQEIRSEKIIDKIRK